LLVISRKPQNRYFILVNFYCFLYLHNMHFHHSLATRSFFPLSYFYFFFSILQ
jgi:hypothetical protein